MVKVRKRRTAHSIGPPALELNDGSPGRIRGATITSWNGPPEIDLTVFVAAASSRLSVAGSGKTAPGTQSKAVEQARTVWLSDGTEITFAATEAPSVKVTA